MSLTKMAGARQKPPDTLVFKRGGRADAPSPTVPVALRVDMEPPEGLLPESQAIFEVTLKWARERLLPTDYFGVKRWILWVDQWQKEMDALATEGMVTPGRHAMVLNPRVRAIKMIEDRIISAEQAMGLDPRARMRLGITFAEEQRALSGLKRERQDRRPEIA